ncbi:MAG TPA: hypothetical protein VNK04_22950 [Gemmataceae bacterium]|nr:hypothetical protein [Gemmataceae bacterium]
MSMSELLLVCGSVLFAAGWLLIPAYVGSYLGRSRAIGSGPGFALGILLGWLGVIIVLCFPYRGLVRKCPFCAEMILREAVVCKHCCRPIPAAPQKR